MTQGGGKVKVVRGYDRSKPYERDLPSTQYPPPDCDTHTHTHPDPKLRLEDYEAGDNNELF